MENNFFCSCCSLEDFFLSSDDHLSEGFETFICKNETNFVSHEVSNLSDLLKCILNRLEKSTTKSICKRSCLSVIRILSRNKANGSSLNDPDLVEAVLLCCLFGSTDIINDDTLLTMMIESVKVLCNLCFTNKSVAVLCWNKDVAEQIVARLSFLNEAALIPNHTLYASVQFYDLRLLFLITALVTESRVKLHSSASHKLTEILSIHVNGLTEPIASNSNVHLSESSESVNSNAESTCLKNVEIDLFIEVLKILFNLTCGTVLKQSDSEDESWECMLFQLLLKLLVLPTESKEKRRSLHVHTINLLLNFKTETFYPKYLKTTVNDKPEQASKKLQYHIPQEVHSMLEVLKYGFECSGAAGIKLAEDIGPVMQALANVANAMPSIRRALKRLILPPLSKEALIRLPQEGEALRNRLCRLMTSPNTTLCSLAADFIFILCSRNIQRMIRYTGYGNAAGLLAARGLLGLKNPCEYQQGSSSDSDNEDYQEVVDEINPITGRWEPPCTDPSKHPFYGMTEEQKEVEAMKLVNAIDQLQREKVICPAIPGPDGRPRPIEHVLQLQNNGTGPEEDENSD